MIIVIDNDPVNMARLSDFAVPHRTLVPAGKNRVNMGQ